LIYLTEEEKYVMYDGENFVDIPEKVHMDGEGLSMSLYELNKSIISQLPAKITYAEQHEDREKINKFFGKNGRTSYMLLCKDISYYTFFEKKNLFSAFDSFAEAVLECVKNVGSLLDVEVSEDGELVEIWVRTEKENICMYLMDAEPFCVSFGG
jgi:hypothetical protein